MSVRRRSNQSSERASLTQDHANTQGQALTYDDLTPTEKQVATLGVSPDALKPIAFLNQSHFETLTKANAISSGLAQQLVAFQTIAENDPTY
jgi:hypothetical protein